MRMRILAGVAALAVVGAVGGAAMAFKVGDPVKIPSAADDFRLVDNTGFARNLRRLVDVKAIVIVSQLNGDEGSRKAAKTLAGLQASNPGVHFLMLNSDLRDGRTEIAAEASTQGYAIPVMDDEVQLVG